MEDDCRFDRLYTFQGAEMNPRAKDLGVLSQVNIPEIDATVIGSLTLFSRLGIYTLLK